MNDPLYNHLLELSWRQKLTEAEEAQLEKLLEAHPETKADWELESQLNFALGKLPEAPSLASNFTAQVMQEVDREAAVMVRATSARWRIWSFHGWLPKAASALSIVVICMFGIYRHQMNQRELMAQSVAKVADVFSATKPELMANSDAIWRLSAEPAKPDVEMLALMK